MALNPFLQSCYRLSDPAAVKAFYDRTAASYDTTLLDQIGYVAPQVTVAVFVRYFQQSEAPVIDLGCGTGLVGAALQDHGFGNISGADYSPAMLEQARAKAAYRHLATIDLNQPLKFNDGAFAAAISVGALSAAHIGVQALDEIVRIVRPGGIVCLTLNERALHEHGFAARFDALAADGRVEQLELSEHDYHINENIKGWVCVLRVS